MTTDWNWAGARWWKCDFHTHTPASSDYGKGPEQAALKSRSPREWLLDFMRAGVDCVAVTDHNSGAWIDKLKLALSELRTKPPEGYRPLTLFPGVELSVNGGVHVLVILSPEMGTPDTDGILGAVGFTGVKGDSQHETAKSLVEVAQIVESRGGLVIPAHADDHNGLFKLSGATLSAALECKSIFAVEIRDPDCIRPQLYTSKPNAWAEILGSDAHHPSGQPGGRFPGSHYTWVKMGRPDLEGLRLALLDGALSLWRSDESPGNPNQYGEIAIESVEIHEARYVGRGSPFELRLSPWLNAIIGGRGTGKSTLVEMLRIVFRRDRELPGSLDEDLKKYREIYRHRDEEGLLTERSRLIVYCVKNGERFRLQWSANGDLAPIEQPAGNGEWRRADGEVFHRFPVRIYSQKQIFHMAKDPLALLHIIDEASTMRDWNEDWKKDEVQYLALCAKARELEAGLADEPLLRGELEDVQRKLAIYEEEGHAELLRTYHARQRQLRAVQAWEENWAEFGGRLRAFRAEAVPPPLDHSDLDLTAPEILSLLELSRAITAELEDLGRQIEGLAARSDRIRERWSIEIAKSDWKLAVEKASSDYEALSKRLAEEGAGAPTEYGQLVQQRHAIESRLHRLDERRTELGLVNAQAAAIADRLSEKRRDLTARREAFLTHLLAGNSYVRMQIKPYGMRDFAERELRRLLQREDGAFERDFDALVRPLGDCGVSTEVENVLSNLKKAIRGIAGGGPVDWQVQDQRFAAHCARLTPEVLDRLALWYPEDTVEVRYSLHGDGMSFRPIEEGSPGQKTAALLAFLLSHGNEPLILDQPEDDLDNKLIYDLVVAQIRTIKPRRQVIVVTHNANIVVNGDAELVAALRAVSGQTQVECAGCLQEPNVRAVVCAVMEGGRTAFQQRYRRIELDTA